MNTRLAQIIRAFGPVLGLLIVYLIFLLMGGDKFRSLYNSKTILQQSVIIGTAALGMTLVIISRGIDLSVGSMLALGGCISAAVLREWGFEHMRWYLPLLAALAGIAVCTLCGWLNGVMVSLCGIVPFIVTLGTMQIYRGVAKELADQTVINTPGNWLQNLMKVERAVQAPDGSWEGVWYSVAPGVVVMLVLTVVMWIVLRHTVFGRHVYGVGSNQSTARLCGIGVRVHRLWVYSLCGLFTGIAGVMQFAALNSGDPTTGIAFELDVIAAVVIGGGSFEGGEGSVIGSIVGAIMIAVLRNGCNLAGVSNSLQNIIIGGIIVGVAAIDRLRHTSTG